MGVKSRTLLTPGGYIMPLGSALNSARLLLMNLNVSKPTRSVIKKEIDKPTVFPAGKTIDMLERDSAENHGYSQEYIDSFLNEIACDLSIRANRILVIKDDKVIAERYEYPYVKDSWDCVFSATKTVTALALGTLYDDGLIKPDDVACRILGVEKKVGNFQNRKITIKNLLTMSTGNMFNEMESAASLRWIKDFFDSANKFPIGSRFEYNSLNTYILGACIEKITGKHLDEYVKERIFDPLGINDTFFERSPEGVAKSGWGLYILPEDMAKLGILMRDYGLYRGKRILSEKWIKMMSSKQIPSTKAGHRFDYGFQTWVDEKKNFCCYNGMYNQDVLIYRNSGIVVVMCCANNEAFHGSNHYTIAEKYFADKEQGAFSLEKHKGGRDLINDERLFYHYDRIVGKTYRIIDKKANSCGILPLLIQNEMGTYAGGIKSFTFHPKKEDGEYTLVISEADKEVEMRFSFSDAVRQIFDFYGNKYDCKCDARFLFSGKGEPYLVVRVFFLEFASSRYFSFRFGKNVDELSVEASENPGLGFIEALLESQDKTTKALLGIAGKLIDPDLVDGKARAVFSPTFVVRHKE